MVAVAFERAFAWQKAPVFQALVLLAALLPGIFAIINLHPYEYVYYNGLVGGTGGAYRRFEMEYWGTSYKEIAEHLNATAPSGSRIVVFGPIQLIGTYVRKGLVASAYGTDPAARYDYAVLQTRANADQFTCPEAPTAYVVGRQGAVFSIVRGLAGTSCTKSAAPSP
jgi:hypothetical protein